MKRFISICCLLIVCLILYVPSRATPSSFAKLCFLENQSFQSMMTKTTRGIFVKSTVGSYEFVDRVLNFPILWKMNPILTKKQESRVAQYDYFRLIGIKARAARKIAYFQSLYAFSLLVLQRFCALIAFSMMLIPLFAAMSFDAFVVRRRRAALMKSPRPGVWFLGWNCQLLLLSVACVAICLPFQMSPLAFISFGFLGTAFVYTMIVFYHRYA